MHELAFDFSNGEIIANNESDQRTVKLTREKAVAVAISEEMIDRYHFWDVALWHTHGAKQMNGLRSYPWLPW